MANELPSPSKPAIGPGQPKEKLVKPRSFPWIIGCLPWCRKYFLEGQALSTDPAHIEENTEPTLAEKLLTRYRRPISMIIPATFFHVIWWCVAIHYDLWHLFQIRYPMTITMIFGSMIAGMTSEGGGAVAFPVMTLILGIEPEIARDFSVFIQACGMMAATFAIFFMRVQVEWYAIIFCSLGGTLGLVIGLEFIDPLLTPPQKKMAFVSIWFSFAFALFLLNRVRNRRTCRIIQNFSLWKAIVLVVTGWFGGVFTSFAGSGLDICSFAVLSLLFRVTEKTATPTSVILMGFNSVVGAFWRIIMMNDVSDDAFEFLYVCVPIVVIGAPLGSIVGSHFHRQVLAGLVYILDIAALITAFVLIKQTTELIIMSISLIIAGGIVFFVLTKLGERLLWSFDKIVYRRAARHLSNLMESGEIDSPAILMADPSKVIPVKHEQNISVFPYNNEMQDPSIKTANTNAIDQNSGHNNLGYCTKC